MDKCTRLSVLLLKALVLTVMSEVGIDTAVCQSAIAPTPTVVRPRLPTTSYHTPTITSSTRDLAMSTTTPVFSTHLLSSHNSRLPTISKTVQTSSSTAPSFQTAQPLEVTQSPDVTRYLALGLGLGLGFVVFLIITLTLITLLVCLLHFKSRKVKKLKKCVNYLDEERRNPVYEEITIHRPTVMVSMELIHNQAYSTAVPRTILGQPNLSYSDNLNPESRFPGTAVTLTSSPAYETILGRSNSCDGVTSRSRFAGISMSPTPSPAYDIILRGSGRGDESTSAAVSAAPSPAYDTIISSCGILNTGNQYPATAVKVAPNPTYDSIQNGRTTHANTMAVRTCDHEQCSGSTLG